MKTLKIRELLLLKANNTNAKLLHFWILPGIVVGEFKNEHGITFRAWQMGTVVLVRVSMRMYPTFEQAYIDAVANANNKGDMYPAVENLILK